MNTSELTMIAERYILNKIAKIFKTKIISDKIIFK